MSDSHIVERVVGSVSDPVRSTDAKDLFQRLTAKKDWHSEAEELNRRRFEKIYRLLTNNLTELREIRAGKSRIDIIVCGKAGDGDLCGIWMKAIET